MIRIKLAACGAIVGLALCVAQTQVAHAQFKQSPPTKAWLAKKAEMTKLGVKHKTAWDLYQYFKAKAHGGDNVKPQDLPDWTGVWTRIASPFFFDPDQQPGQRPTANLTPKYKAQLDKILAMRKKGIEYDPISACGTPPGFPRWLAEPFLREFIDTPTESVLINEANNDVRRIYTDGRGHPPKEDQYPLYNGDSIGFWDGDKLVVHTDELKAGIYQRGQPTHSNKVQTVEIWHKVSDNLMDVYVWIYDPPSLEQPWFMRQQYKKLSNKDKSLRIRYWACSENPNNDITKEKNGASTFTDFTFTKDDDKKKGSKK